MKATRNLFVDGVSCTCTSPKLPRDPSRELRILNVHISLKVAIAADAQDDGIKRGWSLVCNS